MSTHGGGTRSGVGGGRARSGGGKAAGIPRQGKAPWEMTYDQFRDYRVPTSRMDRSRSPGDVEELRGEGSLLSDYVGDRYTLRDFLGHGYDSRYDMSHLAPAVAAGRPLTVYRATDAEQEIWPGAYVTPSRAYAADHGEHNLGEGARYHVLSTTAYPDELVAMNPNEFFYVPRDLHAWHESQVRAAVKAGEPVPENVRAEYGL